MIPPHWLGTTVNVTETLSGNLQALTKGVLSNAIDMSDSLLYYTGGVYDGACGDQPNHGISTVGYGTDAKAGDYWLLKNSFVSAWVIEVLAVMGCG